MDQPHLIPAGDIVGYTIWTESGDYQLAAQGVGTGIVETGQNGFTNQGMKQIPVAMKDNHRVETEGIKEFCQDKGLFPELEGQGSERNVRLVFPAEGEIIYMA
jgi:hypothetical protein